MKYARLDNDINTRYDDHGRGTLGELVVGEDHAVYWFTRDELAAMNGGDDQNRPTVYEDAHGPGKGPAGMSEHKIPRQARRLIDTVYDANRGFPELAKVNPALAKELNDRQRAVADCRRRAASNRKLLDMRLD